MKRIVFFIAFAGSLSSSAWATTYSVEIDAQVNEGRSVSKTLIVREGETGSFTFDDLTLKFVPTSAETGAVKIQAQILKKDVSGLQVVSKPALVTLLNQSAQIEESTQFEDGTKTFRLKITPKKL